ARSSTAAAAPVAPASPPLVSSRREQSGATAAASRRTLQRLEAAPGREQAQAGDLKSPHVQPWNWLFTFWSISTTRPQIPMGNPNQQHGLMHGIMPMMTPAKAMPHDLPSFILVMAKITKPPVNRLM